MFETPSRRENAQRPRINRAPSPFFARLLPWLSILVASTIPGWFVIASAPMLPPFGFLVYLSWRQMRPGLLPVWAGLPFGLVDDLFSGQPFGSAVLLWSLATIAIDLLEMRFPWRNFMFEWLVATSLIVFYIFGMYLLASLATGLAPVRVIMPQLVISIFAYPLIGRIVARIDRIRLTPFRVLP